MTKEIKPVDVEKFILNNKFSHFLLFFAIFDPSGFRRQKILWRSKFPKLAQLDRWNIADSDRDEDNQAKIYAMKWNWASRFVYDKTRKHFIASLNHQV